MLVSTKYQHESAIGLPMSPPTWVLAFKNTLSPDVFWGTIRPAPKAHPDYQPPLAFNCHHTHGCLPQLNTIQLFIFAGRFSVLEALLHIIIFDLFISLWVSRASNDKGLVQFLNGRSWIKIQRFWIQWERGAQKAFGE